MLSTYFDFGNWNIQHPSKHPSWFLYHVCTILCVRCCSVAVTRRPCSNLKFRSRSKFIRTAINNFTLQIMQLYSLYFLRSSSHRPPWCGGSTIEITLTSIFNRGETFKNHRMQTENFRELSLDWKFNTDFGSYSHHIQKLNERENLRVEIDSSQSAIYRKMFEAKTRMALFLYPWKIAMLGEIQERRNIYLKGVGSSHSRFSSTHL